MWYNMYHYGENYGHTTETPQPEVTEENYPSIDLIYPLAIESYETSRQRMITQDNRIHQMMTLTLAITGAIPILYEFFKITPREPILTAAFFLFAAALFLLVVASARNALNGISIGVLHRHYIKASKYDAMEALIKHAGEADKEDEKYMHARNRLIIGAMVCLGLGVLVFVSSGFGLIR